MNRLYKNARQSEATTRKLVLCYAKDIPVKQTAKLTGLSERQIGTINQKLRERLHPYLPNLRQKYLNTDAYQASFKKYRRAVFTYILLTVTEYYEKGRLPDSFSVKSIATAEDERFLSMAYRYYKREIDQAVEDNLLPYVHSILKSYISFHKNKKKGLSGFNYDFFEEEYTFRWVIGEYCLAGGSVDIDLSQKNFSHPAHKNVMSIAPSIGWESHVFGITEAHARVYEKEIISILLSDPIE